MSTSDKSDKAKHVQKKKIEYKYEIKDADGKWYETNKLTYLDQVKIDNLKVILKKGKYVPRARKTLIKNDSCISPDMSGHHNCFL